MDTKQLENWADELIMEYEKGRKGLHSMKNNLGDTELDKQDKTQINSMIGEMTEAIEWMKIGRRPGNRRGIDKRSAYQRRAIVDMDLFPSMDLESEQRELTEDEKRAILNVLVDLSHRERQCYLLHMAQGMSMQEIADELGIKKPSVQKFILRAKNKISCHTNVIRTRIKDERALS
ncbi:sigma-70 family RNA polymerase sigma factor [Ornithinibacillus sp. JPR2-1]|uniref:sigma-70 family RNA polymerase sigma factor n=1 Tax=Ornithinibacillus sp. JPR2-1 TaxID=2094019 RepID=UPI0031DC2A49